MMKYLELELRGTHDPRDAEWADIIEKIRLNRGDDIPFPTDTQTLSTELVPTFISPARRRFIGEALRDFRKKELGLSQLQLSKRIPIDQSLLSKIERGTRRRHAETLLQICQATDADSESIRRLYVRIGLPIPSQLKNN